MDNLPKQKNPTDDEIFRRCYCSGCQPFKDYQNSCCDLEKKVEQEKLRAETYEADLKDYEGNMNSMKVWLINLAHKIYAYSPIK